MESIDVAEIKFRIRTAPTGQPYRFECCYVLHTVATWVRAGKTRLQNESGGTYML